MRKKNSDFHDLINIFENECSFYYLVSLVFLVFDFLIFSPFRDKFVMVKTELVDDVMSTMFPSEVPICSLCLPFSLYLFLCISICNYLSVSHSIYLYFHLSIYFQFTSLLVSIIVYFSLFILLSPSLISSLLHCCRHFCF